MCEPRRQTPQHCPAQVGIMWEEGWVTLGGHGFGKLTGKKIETLSRYYRMAVQTHPHDVNGMQNAILASFNHCSSTDQKPQHDRCPVGARSWCFYQKALATGQEPGPHRTNVESLHSVVWSKCPKTTFVGIERVVSATCSAVSQFNAGIKVTMKNLCDVMQVPSGAHLLASAEKADRRRLQQAKRQTLAALKKGGQASPLRCPHTGSSSNINRLCCRGVLGH